MTDHARATAGKKGIWPARIILAVVALLVLVIADFALAAILPVWWANVIGNQAQGNPGTGILLGMFCGFVFTFIPLVVAWQATYGAVRWPLKFALLLVAVALAVPNLLTAAIMISNSAAAHNSQRILGTDATWFPLWTQISAAATVVVFVVGALLWTNWRQRGKQVRAFRKAAAVRSLAAKAAEQEASITELEAPTPATIDGRDNGR
ncbi:MAG TPA: hypothetical protein VIM08_01020 [Arthrobacter sp.]|jgi:hypothetical protein